MDTALVISQQALVAAMPQISAEDMEKALAIGDLSKLPPELRCRYYFAACQSAGLNPLTKPFTLMKNQAGETFLYANATCAEQLRKRDSVSIHVVSRETDDGLYTVVVRASLPSGRCEESLGAVDITNLKGQNLANARMKAETKAKRRATMAICGLGFSFADETPGTAVAFNQETGEILEAQALTLPQAPSLERNKAVAEHIADLFGDPKAPESRMEHEITMLLREGGASPEECQLFWANMVEKYHDLTPSVLSIIHGQVEKRLAERQRQRAQAPAVTPSDVNDDDHGDGHDHDHNDNPGDAPTDDVPF